MQLRAIWRHLVASDAELDADEQRHQSYRAGTSLISDCRPRTVVDVAGSIRSLTTTPPMQAPQLVVELYDGSGSIDLVFMGRRQIPGIAPGRDVRAHGRLGAPVAGGARQRMCNPDYQLLTATRSA